jgi:hypothetical protein
MKKRSIPCISEDMRKEWKTGMEEDQRMDIIRDIGMDMMKDLRKDTTLESIEECGLEQHGP